MNAIMIINPYASAYIFVMKEENYSRVLIDKCISITISLFAEKIIFNKMFQLILNTKE